MGNEGTLNIAVNAPSGGVITIAQLQQLLTMAESAGLGPDTPVAARVKLGGKVRQIELRP